ncbi:thioredoxin-dependent thiol peroxidase [Corynebacterium poyangense]|uniref:thioredoxin-dependent peroxiredoxin n=1 Tax=Corynebacterium poyangense TaxID=2684405 RepID=A0A7H0SQR4_9CORY|nr:thioredoxin-dependent thiol peroxidase [Corynebacterium poyangense]MBZ8178235.1 thioredoxin-dependent thiol peroxidase [Corynebacterium poyangense]QNQ90889.1 thioredoxin-dependent thiol peroxidase [Corynebacterium poyangense]
MTEHKRLNVGDPAPDFTLPNHEGKNVSLGELLAGHARLVLYFYPRANTPGCTKEACDFRDNLAELSDAGVAVVGISPDQPEKLAAFRDKFSLPFPLLSDPEHRTLSDYGAWGEKKNYGRVTEGVIRSTFVIGSDAHLELAQYNVRATGHVARLIRNLPQG